MSKTIIIILLPLLLLFASGCATNHIRGTEPKICPVHNIALTKMVVPLGYGLPLKLNENYLHAKETLFPNSELDANGGCFVSFKELIFPGHSKAKVLACEVCNQAEKEWLKNNDKYDYKYYMKAPNPGIERTQDDTVPNKNE